jgi:hypothetical protein
MTNDNFSNTGNVSKINKKGFSIQILVDKNYGLPWNLCRDCLDKLLSEPDIE